MASRRKRRGGSILAIPALIVTVLFLILASPSASASPMIPGVPDCKDAPTAQMPGDGVTGFLDGKPDPLPPQGDPFVPNPTTSVYQQFGYAGLTWHTYDLGCGGDLRDINASADTMIGNATLALATWGVAATNGLHNKIAHPSEYMAPLDDVVAAVSARIKEAIWNPWGAVALLGVVVLLLWYSTSGRLSSVTKAAAWAVLVLAVLAGVAQSPTRISAFFDQSVTGSIAQINVTTAGLSSLPEGSDTTRAQGALLVDRLLYDSWLRGEFGSPDSPAAIRWGPALFKASAYTWAEAERARDPEVAKRMAEEKASRWKAVTAEIQDKDPHAYLALQGKAGGRAGVGIMAIFGMAFTCLFRIIADLFMLSGLVMLRFLVMFFPAVAVLGVMAPMSAIVHRVANMAGASVVNVIAFGAGAAVHATVISALLSRAQGPGMNVLVLILCLVCTIAAFVLLLPLLSLTNIVGMSAGGRGTHALQRAGRQAVRYGTTRKAVGDGTRNAYPEGPAGRGGPPAESFARPERWPEQWPEQRLRPRSAPVPATAAAWAARPVAAAALTAGPASGGARPLPSVTSSAQNRDDQNRDNQYRGNQYRGNQNRDVASRRLVPIEGVVVHHPPRRMPEALVVHDSETIVAPDGVGPRLFDPETKSSVRIDSNGSVIGQGAV